MVISEVADKGSSGQCGANNEDWVELQHVRPYPPEHPAGFLDAVRVGAPLEILFEEGWWEVEMRGRDGPNYVVVAKRYKVEHRVDASRLRPRWTWVPASRTWKMNELKYQA